MLPSLETVGVFGGQYQSHRGGHVPQYRRFTHECDGRSDDGVGDFARKISLLAREVSNNGDSTGRECAVRPHSSASDSDSNNNGFGRSSFDMLLSDLASMELASSSAAARRKSEGDSSFGSSRPLMGGCKVTSRVGRFGDGFSRYGGSVHGGASAADVLSNNHPPVLSTNTGFIIDSKPVTSTGGSRKFRAGPSVGAHASKLVDGGESARTRTTRTDGTLSTPFDKSQPMNVPMAALDADLHDTYGAHDWATPGGSADWRKAGNKQQPKKSDRVVSKSPTLSPIRSPIGSPMMSPRRPTMPGMPFNLSSHVSPNYLERRSARLAQMQREDDAAGEDGGGRGYIAEAKRVLDEAMHMLDASTASPTASPPSRSPVGPETGGAANGAAEISGPGSLARTSASSGDALSMSPSGALEPLMKHLKFAAGDDAKCRSALRTLSLLETNLPNREITSQLHGRRILMDVVLKCSKEAIDVKENAIQLMWDLDRQSGRNAAGVFNENDLHALVQVLGETTSCEVASHTLHFLKAAIELPIESRPYISEDGQRSLAAKLTTETCSHKHPIPDSAQYCLGEALAQILSDLAGVDEPCATACVEQILGSLGPCADEIQCQILLTVLSSLAVKRRLVKILVGIDAVAKILRFTNTTTNSRLHARGFSLWKVVSSGGGSSSGSGGGGGGRKSKAAWYFNDE